MVEQDSRKLVSCGGFPSRVDGGLLLVASESDLRDIIVARAGICRALLLRILARHSRVRV